MSRYRGCIEYATKKFILYEKEGVDFQVLFTDPVLKYHDEVQDITSVKTNEKGAKDGRRIPYKDLLKGSNYIVWGGDKSGKTTILLKIFLDCLTDFNSLQCVPIYMDMRVYYRTISLADKLSLKQLLRDEYNLSHRLAEYVLTRHKLVLLLDNYDQGQEIANSLLLRELAAHKNYALILACNKQMEVSARLTKLSLPHEEVHIHGISRKQMRSLAEKWPIARTVSRDEIVSKIALIFSQLNIGCNYWTVSLFLWIFDRTTDINIHNNVELIDLYIENLLEKPNLALRLSKDFSYENYKDFLAYLAFRLYSQYESGGYAVQYSELVECFDEFKSQNIRVIADSKSVLDYIIDKGVVCGIGGGLYTFRLNGVFEYFLAHYMRIDNQFKKKVIETGAMFLSFANELEMYSGFKRNDEEVLSVIYLNALKAVDLYFRRYPSYKDISPEVGNNPKLLSELSEMVATNAERILPLASDEKDSIEDLVQPLSDIESAVKVKMKYSLESIDTEILSRHVFILGRVFRGMDSLTDVKLINEVFDFIIDQGCLVFYFFMKDIKADISDSREGSAFLDFLENFSPIISLSFIYDAVGHRNLSNLIRKKITELKNSASPSLYKLFVLNFMLIESNVSESLELIDDMVATAGKNNFILESIMLKLIYYIVFMCDSKQLEQELRARVVNINKKIAPREKAGNINQLIDKTKIEQAIRNEPT